MTEAVEWFDYILDETLRANLGPPFTAVTRRRTVAEEEAVTEPVCLTA
jgi:hypothetical protein